MPYPTAPAQPPTPSWRLAGVATVALLLGLGWGLSSLYQSRTESYRHQAERELMGISQLQTQNVAEWRDQRVTDAQALSDDSLWSNAVGLWLRQPGNAALAAPVQERLRILQERARYHAVYLIDAQGQLRLGPQGPVTAPLPLPERAAVQAALAQSTPQVVDLRSDPFFAFPFLGVMAPLFDGNDALGGVWLVSDPRSALYPLLTQWPTPSRTAESSLVQRDGEVVRFLSPLRQAPGPVLARQAPLSDVREPAVQAAQGARGVFYGQDYRGERVMAVANAVADSPWVLVSKIDVDEVLAEMRQRELLVLGLPMSLGLLCAGGLFAFWQRRAWQRERLLKNELQESIRWLQEAQRVASIGHFAYTPSERALALSAMAQELLGLQACAQDLLDAWEAAIAPEERAEVLAQHRQTLHQGTPLQAQYRIRRPSDGQWRWVEVHGEFAAEDSLSGAPRLLGTVQDITDRKHTEEALARYRATLEAKVRLDPLTQVANRRALDEHLASEWQRAMRASRPLALLMVDVDHFKAYNDRYGHVAGDACLRQVAQALRGSVSRAGELVARYGGEEFAVLLPGISETQALQVAKRLCAAVRALGIVHTASSAAPHVTVSIGVASLVPEFSPAQAPQATPGPDGLLDLPPAAPDLARGLFEQADAALYRAKQQGRNQAVAASQAGGAG